MALAARPRAVQPGRQRVAWLNLTGTHQTIQGFGINDTWQPVPFATVADQLFTTTSGIGLTILRVGMNDSSTAGAFYNSFESTNISAAKSGAGSDSKIIGSVWSPPPIAGPTTA